MLDNMSRKECFPILDTPLVVEDLVTRSMHGFPLKCPKSLWLQSDRRCYVLDQPLSRNDLNMPEETCSAQR